MARPENPITGDGPVPDLARALRAARAQAGTPSYKELERKALCSASVLAEAASGQRCPSWAVTESFGAACDADLKALRLLWIRADKSDRTRRRAAVRHSQSLGLATVRRLPHPPASSDPPLIDPRAVRGPDPWAARTAQEYVHQLRALRAWGGNPGVREVYAHAPVPRFYSSRSTFYAALSPKRTSLPPLTFVEMLAQACDVDVKEWVAAWRVLSLREFDKANPSPIPSAEEVFPTEADRAVRALERPAQ